MVELEEPIVKSKTEEKTKEKNKHQPLYNVILLNDNYHSYEYVINLCQTVFAFTIEKGFEAAKTVDKEGRVILWTGTLEVAELKQEQIHALGKDKLIADCQGSMTAILEPIE